jgi:signal transduction histidine kinase
MSSALRSILGHSSNHLAGCIRRECHCPEQVVAAASAMPVPAQLTLPGITKSVPAARQFVCETLADCPRIDDLALAVTELAGNATRWSAAAEHGYFIVAVRTAPRWARIEVTDPGPAMAPDGIGNGWALEIIAAVTDRAGSTRQPGGGRIAWAEVTWGRNP